MLRTRARCLQLRGAKIDAKTSIGPRCQVTKPWLLKLGANILVESDVYFKIVSDNAKLVLDDFVFVGKGTEFDVMLSIAIGKHSLIAPGGFITDHSHGIAKNLRIDQQPCFASPVSIGMDVWIGSKVTILAGVTIGDGAVIAAHSVVNRDVSPYTIFGGAPACFLKKRV